MKLLFDNEIQKINQDKQVLYVLHKNPLMETLAIQVRLLLIFGSLIWNMTKLKKNLLLLIVNS